VTRAAKIIKLLVMKKISLILLAALCSTSALAQDNPAFEVRQVALPLVSVGNEVSAGFGLEDYRLVVSGSSLVRTVVEIFSPDTNKADLTTNRNTSAYFGDELYGKNPDLKTTFTLRESDGRVLARRTFGVGDQHDLQRFYAGVLRPGNYQLQVESKGNGKNAFAVRASNNVRLEASEFTVNLRGEANQDQLVGFIDVPNSALGKTIRLGNYDADGIEEMALSLITPDGASRALTSSPDGQWATDDIPMTEALLGRWRVVARTVSSTKQFSNSFSIRVRLGDEALYTILPGFQSPTNLIVKAVAVSCGSSVGLPSLAIKVNGTSIKTGDTISVTAGAVNIEALNLPGAWIRPIKAVAIQDQTTEITIEYVVLQRIVLTPKPIAQNSELTITVSTLFPYAIPARAELDLPSGISTSATVLFSEGMISSGTPLVWTVPVQNTNPSPETRAIARLGRECGGSQAISSVK
jgi:hypothetical protein